MMSKKIFGAGLLSLVLVGVLSIAAFAQVTTELNGTIETELKVIQHQDGDRADLLASTDFELGFALNAAAGNGNIRAVLKLAETFGGSFSDLDAFTGPINPQIEEAYIQAEGAWWVGGPSVLTTLGRHSVSYNGWVAHDLGVNGIEVAGLEVGALELDAYAGWDVNDRPLALRAEGEIDVAGFEAVLVNRRALGSDDRVFDLAVSAGAEFTEDIIVVGTIARDGENEALGYEVIAVFETLPELDIFGVVFSADTNFAPRYSDINDPDLEDDEKSFVADERGFTIGAWTTQQGVDLGAAFTRVNKHSDANYQKDIWSAGAETTVEGFDLWAYVEQERENNNDPVRTLELGVGYTIQDITLHYTAVMRTNEALENIIEASTTQEVPYLGEVDLSGELRLQDGDTRVSADAVWNAPNGFNLGLHYANYDKEGVRGNLADNVYLTAGLKIEF